MSNPNRLGMGLSLRLLAAIRAAFPADEVRRKALVDTAIRLDRKGELAKVVRDGR